MKKFKYLAVMFITSFVLYLALIAVMVAAFPQGKNDTETNAQIEADLRQYEAFGDAHHLFSTCGREAVGKPWFARLYDLDGKGAFKHWEEEDYPTLKAAITAVEKDYLAHPEGMPKGQVGHYKGN
jgi:hypothetical protein